MKTVLPACLLAFPFLLTAQENFFDRRDADGDGKWSREELPERLREDFERLDTDRDGSREEAAAARPKRPNSGGPGGGKGGPRPHEGVKAIRDLDYAGTGNPRQRLDLYLPEKREGEGPLPVVVFIHGGGWQNGDKSGGGRRVAPYVATGKYAGVSVGYRLSDEAQWPSQIHDCKAAIRWIKANAAERGLDPDRIAVWGTSAGGHLVAMLGVSDGVEGLEGEIGPHLGQNAKVKCVVDFFGPAEMLTLGSRHDNPNSPRAKLLGGSAEENPNKSKNASPVEHVTADDAPFLIVHGTEDRTVPYEQSTTLEKKLEVAGVSAILLTVEGGGHGQGFGGAVDEAVAAYLGQQLLGEKRELTDGTVKAGE